MSIPGKGETETWTSYVVRLEAEVKRQERSISEAVERAGKMEAEGNKQFARAERYEAYAETLRKALLEIYEITMRDDLGETPQMSVATCTGCGDAFESGESQYRTGPGLDGPMCAACADKREGIVTGTSPDNGCWGAPLTSAASVELDCRTCGLKGTLIAAPATGDVPKCCYPNGECARLKEARDFLGHPTEGVSLPAQDNVNEGGTAS